MPDNTPYYRAELSVSPSPPFLPVTHLTPQPPYTPFDSGSPSLKTRITTMENEIKLLKAKRDGAPLGQRKAPSASRRQPHLILPGLQR
uniref:Uncharacterized protein n=1 Tax=Knipowitschia caucasica TaxID=637954 RepID=A0AAV2LN02_KNICA